MTNARGRCRTPWTVLKRSPGGSYDEWLLPERERFRLSLPAPLERLTAHLEARSTYPGAIQYAERLLRLDPLREESYQLLMRLHGARGDRSRALRAG